MQTWPHVPLFLGKPTDSDLERYPAVHLTGPHEWDPSVLDYAHPSGVGEPPWSNDPDERFAFDPHFDEFGDYTQRAIQTLSILDDSSSTLTPCSTLMTNQHVFRTYQHDVSPETPDYENFMPYFGWVNVDTVQKTMEQSTQWGVSLPNTFPMEKHLKSRNPALNISRRHEPVATDTVSSDTPAVDSDVKQAQVFVGGDTLVADAYPMKSGKQFVNTLEDNIRRRGAMDKLLMILPKLKYPIRLWIFLGHITFQIGILSPTTRIRTLLNGGTGLSNPGLIQS